MPRFSLLTIKVDIIMYPAFVQRASLLRRTLVLQNLCLTAIDQII